MGFEEERRAGIGGSDVDDALGELPFGCARRLAYEKLAVPPDYPEEKALLYRRGHDLEPLVCQRYTEETGRKVVRRATAVHPSIPWARVNVDREILGAKDVVVTTRDGPQELAEPGVGVLEAKTHAAHAYARVKREGLPSSHVLQLQWGMWVRDRRWGSFAVLNPETWEMLTFDVAFDPELIARIEPHIRAIWERIQRQDLPDRLDPTDKRCARCAWRHTCQGDRLAAAVLPREERDVEAAYRPELADLLADRANVRATLDEYQELANVIDLRLRESIGDQEVVSCDGWRVYYRGQAGRRSVDMERLRKEFPDAYAACLTHTKPSRPLRVYAV